jgi:transcriptional regulator with XRE-family HTH domain
MGYAEKLYKQMLHMGLNQQKLAKLSHVSDSEVSRILGGKSQPGLVNALRLARAVGVSLDYLADDALETDPIASVEPPSSPERDVLSLANELGCAEACRVLDVARVLGYELAIRRLVGAEAKPGHELREVNRATKETSLTRLG